MKRILVACLLALCLCPAAWGQEEDPAHDHLRALRDQTLEALNAKKLDDLVALCDDQIVMTTMNSDMAHGKEEVKAWFERMWTGPEAQVVEYQVTMEVDRLTTLYGEDTGVASGTSMNRFKLKDGQAYEVQNRWTATVVKKDGQWLLASFHSSANVFDNPVLAAATGFAGKLAAGVGLLAALFGIFLGRLTKRG